MAAYSSPGPDIFTLTRTKVVLMASLAITWWLASLFPHYRPVIETEIQNRLSEARQAIPKIKVDWHYRHAGGDDEQEARRRHFNTSKLALLIEPRPLPHLAPQMLHMMAVVPPDWRFLFIGSNKSVISVGRALGIKHQQVIGKLDLMVLPEPWEIDTKEKVFRLLTDVRFYDEFLPGVEWILKYESDSILCANSPKSLNEWLHWSWVGAPRTADDRFAGNGGLSLRRVSAIKRVLKFQVRQNDTQPEDEWFGTRLWVLKGERVASAADGGLAVEDTYWEKPMGFHVRDGGAHLSDAVWRNHKQRREIFDYCPELALIMDMKLERERCPGDDKEGVIHPTEEELRKQAEEAQRKKEEEERKKKEEQRKKDEEMRLKAEADELSRKVMEDEERRFMESQHAATATAETAETAAAETAAPAPTAASSDEDTVTAQADAEPKPTMAAVSEAVAAGSASAMPPVVMPVHTGDPTNQPHPAETPQPEPSQPAANVNGDADQ